MLSPRIAAHRWGSVEVAGVGTFRDAKLFPGGARAWDWNETGTRHVPGIQMADVQELIDAGARVIVLSRGVHLRLEVMPTTLHHLKGLGIEVHVLQTEEAVERYNELVQAGTVPVGALIHSTC